MTLTLTDKDKEMLNGDHGPATKMSMSILVRMAEISGAKELLDITGAHIDSTVTSAMRAWNLQKSWQAWAQKYLCPLH